MPEMPAVTVPEATAEDVADLLRISLRQAYRLAAERKIPSYRIGSRLRFDLAEVAAEIRATRQARRAG